ncbi:hypothetical protein SLS56_006297 [Neofusicoccum ribis]|uniref:UbiA prenyltransferase n=1 Tax=Neofusicoccum ribis TaxID=45134 RepID=A0ABR3SR75_9PEZI
MHPTSTAQLNPGEEGINTRYLAPRASEVIHFYLFYTGNLEHFRSYLTMGAKSESYPKQQRESLAGSIKYHAYTIWLFSRSDLKTILIPATIFGVANALSGPLLTTNASPDPYKILARVPLVMFSTWLNLLVTDIANQRHPEAIIEDSINKKWRPLPSGRLSPANARRLLLASIPVAVMKSVFLGDTLETLFLIPLIWMYSDLGGADTESHKVRDTLNGLGVTAFNASAATIAFAPRAPSSPASSSFLQPSVLYSNPTYPLWHAVVLLLLCTTISTQDLPDLPGDIARNRRTLPIAHGEPAARRWLAVLIAFWSVECGGGCEDVEDVVRVGGVRLSAAGGGVVD